MTSSKTQTNKLYQTKISRSDRKVVENAFGILTSRFRVLLGTTFQQRSKVIRDTALTCVVLHNILGLHQGRIERAPNPANDTAAIANEAAVYVPNENHRNPSREAKHQRNLLKDNFNYIGALAGQEDRVYDIKRNYPGYKRSWHLSVIFRTTPLFQKLLFELVLHQCPTNFQQISQKFPTILQTISKQIKKNVAQ